MSFAKWGVSRLAVKSFAKPYYTGPERSVSEKFVSVGLVCCAAPTGLVAFGQTFNSWVKDRHRSNSEVIIFGPIAATATGLVSAVLFPLAWYTWWKRA